MSYQVTPLRPLNSGGNGDLWLGQRSDDGVYVVIKYLREYKDQQYKKNFAREIRILSRGLPGVVAILFYNLEAQPPYYVMPYFPGGSLTKYAGRLTSSQLEIVARQLAQALAALHAAHIANGDFKPDNILISPDGQLRVADPLGNGFGCTVLFAQHHGGTPGYWAPEVRNRAPISYASDVFSYGATLYELLTGRRPQDGQRLDPATEGYTGVPKICEIIRACCQANPYARPNMQEVLRMLDGTEWSAIESARTAKRQLVAAGCVVGCLLLLPKLNWN